MNWRLKHKLFGWDYVCIKNSAATKVCRVSRLPNGQMAFEAYSSYISIISEPIPVIGITIDGWHVTPLTLNITK